MTTRPAECKSQPLNPIQRFIATATVLAIALIIRAASLITGARQKSWIVTCARWRGGRHRHALRQELHLGENFNLAVTLQQDVTEAQIRDVARYFADRTDATGLAERSASLSLRLPIVAPSGEDAFTQGLSVGVLPAGLQQHRGQPQRRRDCRRRGGVAANGTLADRRRRDLTAPAWNRAGDSRRVQITLRPDATSPNTRIAVGEPMLADASWGIAVQDDARYRPHTYYATPRPQ